MILNPGAKNIILGQRFSKNGQINLLIRLDGKEFEVTDSELLELRKSIENEAIGQGLKLPLPSWQMENALRNKLYSRLSD